MIDKTSLKDIIEDPKIYYIYEIDNNVFGIEEKEVKLLIIVDKKYKINSSKFPDSTFIYIDDWFKQIEDCKILPWICACLNKKYIIKEYIKLLMATDLYQLRKNIDNEYKLLHKSNSEDINVLKKTYWTYIRNIILTNQIIENHKIVNYVDIRKSYKNIVDNVNIKNIDDLQLFWIEYYIPEYNILKKHTDGALLKRINDAKNY